MMIDTTTPHSFREDHPMELRPLGRTGVKVSSLCLGCMMFGGKTSPDDSYAIIDKAIDQGINFIDTANVYSLGRSEEVTGEALKRNGRRNHVVLATKVHGVMSSEDPNMQGNTRRHIIEQCEASLRRLKTDWIDLYQIHRPQSDVPIDETLRALDDLIRAGKVRYIGSSTFSAWQLVESLWIAKELGLNRFICEQPPYNLLDRRIERELLPMARTYGFAVIPWSPLGGGLLSGKYKRGEEPPEGARFADQSNPIYRRRLNDRIYDVIEGLEPIAAEKKCTLSQLSLAWVLHQPGVTSPIIGPRTMEQFDDNMGALDVEITDDDRKQINRTIRRGDSVAPFYEAEFGPHPYRV
jgi:aryl-alcohol dehydrogenase-like predicted oxidoreductase